MSLRVFSSGAGKQSMAALILSAKGEIDFPIHLFANVGADSENPATLAYVESVIKPYAASHGIRFVELHKVMKGGARDGKRVSVLQDTLWVLERTGKVTIPMRMHQTGSPGARSCTNNFKIRVISQWLRRNGASRKRPAVVGLGISTDEAERYRKDSGEAVQTLEYPLLDLRLSRDDCVRLIEAEGLPVPPKSSCWFCPFASPADWLRVAQSEPETFARAAQFEATVNEARAIRDMEPLWLTRVRRPLAEVVALAADDGEFDACESGYCMT